MRLNSKGQVTIPASLRKSHLVINPIVYAEVSTGFERIEDLEDALPADHFEREPLPYQAGFVAARVFLAYRQRGGNRRSPLADFYIGAHAAVLRYRLLTRGRPLPHLLPVGRIDRPIG